MKHATIMVAAIALTSGASAAAFPPAGRYTYTPTTDPVSGAPILAIALSANGDLLATEADGSTVIVSGKTMRHIALPKKAIPIGINDKLEVLANLPFDEKTQTTSVLIQSATKRTTFRDPRTSFDFSANGFNDAGTAVGTEALPDVRGAVDWLRTANSKHYVNVAEPNAAGTSTELNAINNTGEAVGAALDSTGAQFGVKVASAGFAEFRVPGANGTAIYAVNDAGEIAGLYSVPGKLVPLTFVQDHDGGLFTLGRVKRLNGYSLNVRGLDNAGTVLLVGDRDGVSASFLATRSK